MSGLGEPPDDLDRELMQLEAELAKPARFKEPSAAERARMAAERARMAARQPSRRESRKARKQSRPVFHPQRGPAYEALPARPRPGGSWAFVRENKAFFIGLLVFIGLSTAFWQFGVPSVTHRGGQTPVTSRLRPGGLPSPTIAEPFLGTPAQHWPNGAAGIVIPQATPVGGYSAAQVAAAYQSAKQMLVAANLDRQTLAGGAPDAFASLLIGQQRTQFTAGLDKTGLDSSGSQLSTRTWVTSFAPGTELVGNVIKVHGIIGAAASANNGTPVLQIHVDYLFVYAVERAGEPDSLMRIVQHQIVDVDFGTYTDPGGALQPWWQIVSGGPAGSRCDINNGFVNPQFPNAAPDKVATRGKPVDPYALSPPAQSTGRCQATTGT